MCYAIRVARYVSTYDHFDAFVLTRNPEPGTRNLALPDSRAGQLHQHDLESQSDIDVGLNVILGGVNQVQF